MNGAPPDASSAATIGALLRALVEQHVPPARQDATLAVATRLLDSSLTTAPSMQSVDTLTRTMSFRLIRDGRNPDANALATLITSLKFDRAVAPPALWPLLYILNDLRAQSTPRAPSQTAKPDNPPAREPHPPVPDLFPSVLSPTSHAPLSDSDEPSASAGALITSPDPRPQPSASPTPLQNRSLESTLVQDLLLVVQGDDAPRIAFDPPLGHRASVVLQLPPGVDLPLPMHDMLHSIAELGFLFRVIRAHVSTITPDAGLVAHNFFTAVDRELDEYYRSIVALRESQPASRIPFTSSSPPDGLTLRAMFVWAERQRHRLRWLARLCEETRPLKGGQIVAHLRSRRGSYVSTDVRDMMSRIMRSSAAPLNMMLVRWLSEGVLPDPHGEFFIMEDPKVAAAVAANPFSSEVAAQGGLAGGLAGGPNTASAASNRIWWGLFKMRRDMLPGCVDANTAQKALRTGKSIAFMRRCCTDSEWVDAFHGPLVVSLSGSDVKLFEADLKYDENAVQTVVTKSFTSASQRLKELFFDRFDLSHHFGAIKRYLLLSQGDFAQSLMDGLASILDGDGEALQNNPTGHVDTALQSCSSFNEETDWDILERLDVQIELTDDSSNASGWDVFSLTYRVEDAPLNTVFSRKVMDAYLLIFRLLWRLKRMEYLMSIGYTSLRETDKRRRRQNSGSREERGGAQRKEVDRVMKRVHYLRMKITHLVHNMQHYCKVEVLEGCWTVLEQEMKEAEDLDGMILSHARYLTMIKDMTLQSPRSRYVAAELNGLLDIVPRFSEMQMEICEWAVSVGLSGDVNDLETRDSADEMMEKLDDIEREFDLRFEKFLDVLAAHCQMVDACVYLLFRLDFNEYYIRRQQADIDPFAGDLALTEEDPVEE